ncbi:MAG TPA: SRPBCC domain-containing protein [Chitinophagales bacterium]|nr:SRPBCC domain-containing protein [Chitinophagales bacterium]
MKLIANERIVQAWSHTYFPEGHYSNIDLQLKPTRKGTRINFYHYGIPAKLYKDFNKGGIMLTGIR